MSTRWSRWRPEAVATESVDPVQAPAASDPGGSKAAGPVAPDAEDTGGGREPLRIAAHNGAPELGGAEIATAILLGGLAERGHDVVLFYNREVVARGVAGYGIEVRPGRLGGDIAVHHALRFAARLRRYRADVLIVGTFRKLWLAALAARLAGVPVVARIGLSTDVPRNVKYRWVFRHWVDAVVTNADDLAAAYRAALPEAPPPRIVAVHKGIEPVPTAPAEDTRRGLDLPPTAPLIGGVGRLVGQKRFDRLLRVLARLPPRVHCLIVGAGPLRGDLESLAATLDVAGRVRFTGHRGDVPDVMAALDLLVITSDRESLANVMLEAMAAGTPVVSTPVSGAAEALVGDAEGVEGVGDMGDMGDQPEGAGRGRGGPAGLVVEPDAARLAVAIESLLGDPDRLAAMGTAARAVVERRFGRDRMLDAWETVLRDVATAPVGTGARRGINAGEGA